MRKKIRSKQAVSEVIGVVLLLGITVALFALLNFAVFRFSFDPSVPSANLIGTIDKEHYIINIEHNGGESLEGNIQISITINSTSYDSKVSEIPKTDWTFSNNDKNPDKWDFGETVQYKSLPFTEKDDIRVTVVDPNANAIILSVVLQQGSS